MEEKESVADEKAMARKRLIAAAAIALAVFLIVFAPLIRCAVGGSPVDEEDSYVEDDTDYESADYDSDHSESDYSYSDPDDSYSSSSDNSSDGDYDYLYDEDSGISGVMNDDGEGIFSGDDFAMRRNEDGSSVATDGKGNWIADSDGDGEIDSMSIDGGETWF